jgi:hypothetical protein
MRAAWARHCQIVSVGAMYPKDRAIVDVAMNIARTLSVGER